MICRTVPILDGTVDADDVYGRDHDDLLHPRNARIDDAGECDHPTYVAECGVLRCTYCGRRV